MTWEYCKCGAPLRYPTLKDLLYGQDCPSETGCYAGGYTKEYSDSEKLKYLLEILIDKGDTADEE